MKRISVITIVLSVFYSLSAQEDSARLLSGKDEKRFKINKTWILLNNGSESIKGVLYEITDSSVLVSNSIMRKDYTTGKFDLSKIYYNDIDNVKTRRKNSVVGGTLIGAVAGFAIGGLIGILSGDDDPDEFYFASTAEEKAIENGIILSIIGGSIGAIVGSIKVKIPINGNMGNFNMQKNKLKKHALR